MNAERNDKLWFNTSIFSLKGSFLLDFHAHDVYPRVIVIEITRKVMVSISVDHSISRDSTACSESLKYEAVISPLIHPWECCEIEEKEARGSAKLM